MLKTQQLLETYSDIVSKCKLTEKLEKWNSGQTEGVGTPEYKPVASQYACGLS